MRHDKSKSVNLLYIDSDNKFVQEFGGKEDLFTNTIINNPRGTNTGSHENINCINCQNCIDCQKCIDCQNCIDCIGCVSCKNCSNCKNKKYAVNLIL